MHLSEFEDAYDDLELIRGAILTTPVAQLNLRPPICVGVAATVSEAVAAMNEHHTGCVLVERDGRLAGIFTERDILTRVVFQLEDRNMPVASVMTADPESLEPNSSIAYALNKMSVGGYRHIPVVDGEGKVQGVVSVRDLVDFLVEMFPTNVLNLPPNPSMAIPRTADGG